MRGSYTHGARLIGAGLGLGLLAACASWPQPCASHRDAASAAGAAQRWLDPLLETAPPDCHPPMVQAWLQAASDTSCTALLAFVAGRFEHPWPADCSEQRRPDYELGRTIGALEREHAAIVARLDDPSLDPNTRRDLNQRRIVIERDLPELHALARFDALLPPARLDEAAR